MIKVIILIALLSMTANSTTFKPFLHNRIIESTNYNFDNPISSSVDSSNKGYIFFSEEDIYSMSFEPFSIYKKNTESQEITFVSEEYGHNIAVSNNKVFYKRNYDSENGLFNHAIYVFDEKAKAEMQLTPSNEYVTQFILFEDFICYCKRDLDENSREIGGQDEFRIVSLDGTKNELLFSVDELYVFQFFFHDELLYFSGVINEEYGFFKLNPKTKAYENIFENTVYSHGEKFFVFENELYFLLDEILINNEYHNASAYREHLYKSDLDGNNIEKIDIFGGVPLRDIAINSEYIFYAEGVSPGGIYKIRRNGSEKKLLFDEVVCENLVLINDSLFFTRNGGLSDLFEVDINSEKDFISYGNPKKEYDG